MQNNENLVVDAVIAWVDGNDPKHRQKMENYIENKSSINSKAVRMRFDQVNEIEYSVKSILKYAKFVRNIYIVTDNQTPDFLKDKEKAQKEYPTVFVVDHKTIFEGFYHYLPTFNCFPIESLLYKIPNLSEHFLYLNDDFFLLREAKVSDFFIDGKPIIRGFWTNFYENIWYKKLQKQLYKFLGKESKENIWGFKKGQQNIAKILGFKKYVRLDHTIAPLRVSTYDNYYKKYPEILELNVKHRFRHPEQYTNQSLANHLEIQNNTYVLKNDFQLVYFQNYKKPFWWIKSKLKRANKDQDKLFLCMQSLDQCPDDKLKYIKNWLQNKYD
ncbi:Stealth protein CR1, conserved region 1 [Polaribacter sp. KT25b]|uniref:Stealth CR1 domain-containing protein n=1 Tax=Polaribacter sp. KT25b TaxID=1855336 RepID=UPI00087961F6|nr:Stealth CR1 domain-containing protein [Polaribacter sp. KT25b]SDR81303.1 Stealth protein CR1, conserved region 1 [Polaribacter sp. KT25b]